MYKRQMYVHTPIGGPTPSELFSTTVNVEVIIAAVLGGMGTIVGAAIGGIFVGLVPVLLDEVGWVIPGLGIPVGEIDFLLFAVITLFLLYVLPGGILRSVLGAGNRAQNWRRDDEVAADGGRPERLVTRVARRWRDESRGGDDDE